MNDGLIFKPCPFCGCTDIMLTVIPPWRRYAEITTNMATAYCSECGAAVSVTTDDYSIAAMDAMVKWNRRAE